MSKKDIVIAYVPALHEGYIRFFKSHEGADFYLVDDSIVKEIAGSVPYYGRDVRAISSTIMKDLVQSLGIFEKVETFSSITLGEIKKSGPIIMPDEDISREIGKKYLSDMKINFESVFLRWDKNVSTMQSKIMPNQTISRTKFDREMMGKAIAEGEKSPDFWRQVGVLAVKNGKALFFGHNTIMPRPDNNHVLGDPRSNFVYGEAIEVSTAIHGEASVIAEAAKKGVSLAGAEIYVSTFPCPNCARLIVRSGIKKVFFDTGYSLVDAYEILKTGGVEIIQVDLNQP